MSVVGALVVSIHIFGKITDEVPKDMFFRDLDFKQQTIIIKELAKKKNLGFRNIENQLSIYNKYFLLEYTPFEENQFTVSELDANPKVFTAIAKIGREYVDVGFIKIVESISTATNYKDILRMFGNIFGKECITETLPKEYTINSDKIKKSAAPVEISSLEIKKIDINNASEQEIASLAGINIISAKKAVKYRDLKGGFSSIDEFFKAINLKQYFIAKIKPQLEIKEYKTKSSNTLNNDRIVDF